MKRLNKVLALILSIFIMASCLTSCKSSDYKKALSYLDEGKYSDAAELFKELGDYKDSEAKLKASNYKLATKSLKDKNFDKASKLFSALGNYKDSKDMLAQTGWEAIKDYIMKNGEKKDDGIYYYTVADTTDEYIKQLFPDSENTFELSCYEKESHINIERNCLSGYGIVDIIRFSNSYDLNIMSGYRATAALLMPVNEEYFSIAADKYTGATIGTMVDNDGTELVIPGITVTEFDTYSDDGKMPKGFQKATVERINGNLSYALHIAKENGFNGKLSDLGFKNIEKSFVVG